MRAVITEFEIAYIAMQQQYAGFFKIRVVISVNEGLGFGFGTNFALWGRERGGGLQSLKTWHKLTNPCLLLSSLSQAVAAKKYRNQFFLVCYMYAAILELTPCVRG